MTDKEMREALAALFKLWEEGGQELCERAMRLAAVRAKLAAEKDSTGDTENS